MDTHSIVTIVIFVVVSFLIALERLPRTILALAGAMLIIIIGGIDQHDALHGNPVSGLSGVDWNTILLLIGMMVIVNISRKTGMFEWLAIRTAKLASGDPVKILALVAIMTAVLSAFLDNVTTVLMFAPLTILIYERLRCDPAPALIAIILASNIGGAATLIGDPPNIVVGSMARLNFMDFIFVNTPVAIFCLLITVAVITLRYRGVFVVSDDLRNEIMQFDEDGAIANRPLLNRCLIVIFVTLTGFVIHGAVNLEPATIAMGGAVLLLLLHTEGLEEAFEQVEWSTIFFFIGLFIMVGGLAETGVFERLSQGLLDVSQGNSLLMTILLLWASAVLTAFLNNVAFIVMAVPLVQSLAATMHPEISSADFFALYHTPDVLPLWWALSLGACFGGIATYVGSAANLIVAGIAESSNHGFPYSRYLKWSIPTTIFSLVVCSFWLWLRFFR
jgi:Na+/H+ antiporter NhaD/arsenite permease-like protein